MTHLDGDDVTQTGIPTIRAQLERVVADREKAASAGRAKAFAAFLAVASTLVGIGVVWQQTRQTSEDVSRVLVVVERLSMQGTTLEARVEESARDRAALHDAQRELERKLYDARRLRPAGGGE